MIRLLGKVLLLVPFFYLLFNLFRAVSYPSNLLEIYYLGFMGLVLLGLVSILFEVNKVLGIIYVLVGFGLYSYFYDRDVYNLWAVGGLLLLITSDKKVIESVDVKEEKPVEKINKVEEKKKINKKLIKKKVVEEKKPVEKINKKLIKKKVVEEKKPVEDSVDWSKYDRKKVSKEEDYWVRYERKRDKSKPIFIKLKDKINKLLEGVGA